MEAPEFWEIPPEHGVGWAPRLLAPAASVFTLLGRLRRAARAPVAVGAPVVCVGNLVAGGSGKTPTTLALCDRLAALGVEAHILSRGYGGRLKGPHRVDPRRDTARDVGDEPLLMSFRRPVWIGGDRVKSAAAAVAAGAEILVMDDGFQNPSLQKDLSILVIDAVYGHGNERVIPAGPLREPLETGFARAQAAIVVGDRPPDRAWPWTPPHLPTLRAKLTAETGGLGLRARRVVAFAGIGRPEKFFQTLRGLGADLVEAVPFPDHHRYSSAILARLEARATAADALLVTTEKDAVRFPSWFAGRATPVPVSLGFADPAAADALLAPLIARLKPRQTDT